MTILLNRSLAAAGAQCLKRLHLAALSPGKRPAMTADQIDESTQLREVRTSAVELAGATRATSVQRTAELMAPGGPNVISDAVFETDSLRTSVDLLIRMPDGWTLRTIKASTAPKPQHRLDLAFQALVFQAAGGNLHRCEVMHLNAEYAQGKVNLDRLFSVSDETNAVAALANDAEESARRYRSILEEPQPDVTVGPHCKKPSPCPFLPICKVKPGPFAISQLPRSGKLVKALAEQGISDLRDLPADVKLSPTQRRVADCVLGDTDYVGPGLRSALADVAYPLQFLDFETFMPALPRYPDTQPYQWLPTQWSLHTLDASGELTHTAYLHDADTDPRLPFANTLTDALDATGTVVVYSWFEAKQIRDIATAFPTFGEPMRQLLEQLQDLLKIVRDHYYHPDFRGSYSIKAVLPALVPDLTYEDLPIKTGRSASLAYQRMISTEMSPADRDSLRTALLDYCKRDTLAMLKVREALLARIHTS